MKNTLIILGMALIASFILPSCKKDYTCTCQVEDQKYIYDYSGQLKSEAQNACDKQDAAAKRANANGTCKLTKE